MEAIGRQSAVLRTLTQTYTIFSVRRSSRLVAPHGTALLDYLGNCAEKDRFDLGTYYLIFKVE